MLEQRIQQQFFESADLLGQAAEPLARPVADAAQAILGALTAGGRLFVAGIDVGAWLAPVMASAFTGRFERDRPPLAAIALRAEAGGNIAQQLRALGQPGDVLLALDPGGVAQSLWEAADAAHAQDMSVVALTGADPASWRGRLSDTDVVIAVPHDRAARVAEAHLLVLHCLCDAVDLQLMGEREST